MDQGPKAQRPEGLSEGLLTVPVFSNCLAQVAFVLGWTHQPTTARIGVSQEKDTSPASCKSWLKCRSQ